MLPKWLQNRFTLGYHKQVNTVAQYQAASRYLRRQMQELVACPCPDSRSVEEYHSTLNTLVVDLKRLQESLPALEYRHKKLLREQNVLLHQADEIPLEESQLKKLTIDLQQDLQDLNDALQLPAHNTYEDTRELLEHWQERENRTATQLSALKRLTSQSYFQHLEEELPQYATDCQQLQTLLGRQQEQAEALEQQFTSLSAALDSDMKSLNTVLSLHRNFLQKGGNIQKQFEVLNQQVPALLKQEIVHSDWFDLVQSWYKANNLATSTVKAASGMGPDYHRLMERCTHYLQQLAECQSALGKLEPSERLHPLRHGLVAFQSTQEQLSVQILDHEKQLETLTQRKDMLLEEAKKKAVKELAQLNTLWGELESVTEKYVSRKEANASREIFEQIRAILTAPYCLRTLHHSPVPATLTQAENYGQYLIGTNRTYLTRKFAELDDYFSHFRGHNLTMAQRTALLTEEDYVQVMGQAGYGKSFTIEAKKTYLQEQLKYAPRQILVLKPGNHLQHQVLQWVQKTRPGELLGTTTVWAQQATLKEQLPQCQHWDILLPALELHEYLCPPDVTLPLAQEVFSELPAQERQTGEALYQDFHKALQTYRELLAQRQLVDAYQLLHLATQQIHTGQIPNTYSHCLVDDFPLLSPLELSLLRALLKSNFHTKLFCTGDLWEFTDELSYIKKSFPRLPWTHFLIQWLLAEGEAWFAGRNYQGGYLSLTETKGEVILLTPLDHS